MVYTYTKRFEGEIALQVLPTDPIGAICFDAHEVGEIGWALLTCAGDLKSGTIRINRGLLAGASDPAGAEAKLYRAAARALNKKLANALVDRRNFTGEPLQSRFYKLAGISPSWRWSGRHAFALIELLSINLQPGLGLRPFLRLRDEPEPEIRARKDLEDYRLLREFVGRCERLNQIGRAALAPASPENVVSR